MMNELQTTETEIVGQGMLFDYASLDAETRIVVQQRAGEIKSIAKRVAADVVEIGEKLADVKQRLGANDRFNDWLSAELGWSKRTAHNFITVYQRFGTANFAIENVAVSALYELAAPSTPAEAVEAVKQIANSGEKVTYETAKEIVRQAKAQRPKQTELVGEPEENCLTGDCQSSEPNRVYVEQADLDLMDRINACDEILNGDPVDFYEIDYGPVIVITMSPLSQDGNVTRARGWRIVSEHEAGDVAEPPRKPGLMQNWIGKRVNVNTKRRPNWWVIVGPEYEFERKPAEEKAQAAIVPESHTGAPETAEAIPSAPPPVVETAPTPVSVEKRTIPETSSILDKLPPGWLDMRIEISATLVPGAATVEARQVLYKVRVGDEECSVAETELATGEDDVISWLSDPAVRCLDKAVAAFLKMAEDGDEKRERLHKAAIARWRGERIEDDEDDDMGFRPGFPPSFDVKRAEQGVAQENRLTKEEQEKYLDAPCSCGHSREMHDEDGVCAALNCGLTTPRVRCSGYECADCGGKGAHWTNREYYIPDGPTPIPTELPQAEINRIADHYIGLNLDEDKPINLCYIAGAPYVVTGCVSSGDAKNWESVIAWPAMPPNTLTAQRVLSYAEAQAEHRKKLKEFIENDAPNCEPLSYKGVKVNCGTKKKPDWWVIVGPKTEFKVDYSADYPDNEIEVPVDELVIDGSPRANPQINEFGVYVKGVEEIKIPFPKKAGKTEVVIRLVHDQADGMWRSAYSVRAGTGAASSPVMKSDSCYESRELALGAAGEKARAYLLRSAERGDSSDSVKRQINAALPSLDKWIIVNSADHSAAYPDDDIEAPADGPTIEQALHAALHHVASAAERWRVLREKGATDAELVEAVGREFGSFGGSSQHGGYRYKGGKSPQFSWPGYADMSRAQTLKGKRLLAKVREVLGIGAPRQVENAIADDDDFTAPRCSECGRIDGAHSDMCSQRPNILTFEDYSAYAEFTKPKAPRSWARKWELSKEMDGLITAWKLYWEELRGRGITPFPKLCKCGHPLIKHKPEVGCMTLVDPDQSCQCVRFVASAKAEEPKRAKKGREAW